MEQGDVFHPGQRGRPVRPEDIRRHFPRDAEPPPKIRGDHDLNPGFFPPDRLREAAVLVPLIEREEGLTILFTQRTAHLSAHAGQISFPGGRREPLDRSAEDTALRETEEEVGIPRTLIETCGRLDTYVTRTGFQVTPVVGLVRPPLALTPDPTEVAEVFEVPLSFILDPDNPQRHSRDVSGKPRFFYVFPYGQRYIWGATAGMLVNLRDVLRGAS